MTQNREVAIGSRRVLATPFVLLLVLLGAFIGGCGDDDSGGSTARLAISSPADGSAAPVNGRVEVAIDFGAPLDAQSMVRIRLSDLDHPAPDGVDITSLFLPSGATDFSGARQVSATLAPLSAGSLLMPGSSELDVELDRAGDGVIESASSAFEWAPCDPLDDGRCMFPFPNDYFTVADDSSPTGHRLGLAGEAMPTNAEGVAVDPVRLDDLDGFSVGPLLLADIPDVDLAVTGAPPQTDLARSLADDSPVVLIDAENGERQLLWVERDQSGHDPAQRPIMIRVARNLADAHRYIVALRNLRDAAGETLAAGPVFAAYRDGTALDSTAAEARRPHMEEIFSILEDAGVARDDLFLAWDFTTQSTDSVAGNMLHIRDDAFARLGDAAPQFEVTSVEEPLDDKTFRRVRGTFQVPLYLTDGGIPGSSLRFGPDGLPVNEGDFFTARFECVIPFAATTDGGPPAVPARISLYGHGLLGDEGEVSAGNVRDMANEHDFVFCATRWTGFEEDDLPFVLQLIRDFSNFPNFIDRQHQGLLNFLMLARLMKHPDGFSSSPAFRLDGQSLLDTSDVFYDGNSQGGIIGGALAAFSQDVRRFVLGVPGMNYSTLLRRSVDFDSFNDILEAFYPNGFDRALLISTAQTMWDRTDPNGHINHLTGDTYPDTPAKKVLYHVAFSDHQVATLTAEIAARNTGARIHQPALSPDKIVPDVEPYYGIPAIASYPYDGSAIVIWDSGNPAPPVGNVPPMGPLKGDPGYELLTQCAASREGDPHECPRRSPDAREQKSEFLQTDGAVVDVCGGEACMTPP